MNAAPDLSCETIDARGYRCPMPVLLMERAIRRGGPGERFRVIADDPIAAVDIPHFAAAAGWRAEKQPGDPAADAQTCVFLVTAAGNHAS